MFDFKIIYDTEPQNPREEWDNLGTMWCDYPRYTLGDTGAEDPFDFEEVEDRWQDWYDIMETLTPDPERAKEACLNRVKNRLIEETLVVLPLYLYDRGGITMSTAPFSCPWDSGQVGYIYVTKEKALREVGHFDREKIIKILENEIRIYAAYLGGRVYGYSAFPTRSEPEYDEEPQFDCPDSEDSCWGYSELKSCVEDAKNTCAALDAQVEAENAQDRLLGVGE